MIMPPSSVAPTSRLLALNVLCQWHDVHAPISGTFDQVVGGIHLDPRDLQLANALVFGVLRQQQYLDYILGMFARHPLRKMKPRTLFALRIGLFQLLLMDRIPESAAVNETVNALKAVRQPKWLVSFVHGVLRNVARKKNELPAPESAAINDQPILNHPDWLLRRWQQRFGREETTRLCRCNNRPPVLTLRTNTRLIGRNELQSLLAEAGVQTLPGKFSSEALCLPEPGGSISGLPGYDHGYFQVQDEAAQLAVLLMPMYDGGIYLDACAGLGGKTSHLAALAPETTRITAVEPDKRRYRLLGENLNRLRLDQVTCCNTTLEQFAAETKECFDGILLDAPCSGTGVIRRQPDIRWNRREEELESYHQQQVQLLKTAAGLLKKNGVLVYATCSLEPEENEEVVQAFLAGHSGFFVENGADYLPQPAACLVDKNGYFHPIPADGLDGFFAVRLQQKQS